MTVVNITDKYNKSVMYKCGQNKFEYFKFAYVI